MAHLTLEHFLQPGEDFERQQYLILDGAQRIRTEFAHNRIYPAFSELIEIHSTLTRIIREAGALRAFLPHRIVGIDLREQRVLYEPIDMSGAQLAQIEDSDLLEPSTARGDTRGRAHDRSFRR